MSQIDSILAQRGILTAARRAGWRACTWCGQSGWSYPTHDLVDGSIVQFNGRPVLHFKNASKSGAKYAWLYGFAVYYTLPGLRDQIDANSGIVYLASGSPDVLAYQSAGLPALSWFNGETAIPDTLPGDLAQLGAKQVIYCPDRDTTGEASARKLIAALAGRLPLTCLRLPVELGPSGDINRLWQAAQFDQDRFRSSIESLPTFEPVAASIDRSIDRPASQPAGPDICPECAANYFQRVMSLELSALANAPDHDRNNQLNRSAFALGTLLGAGIGTRTEIECSLTDIARLRGLGEYEAARTITSGIGAGLRKPRAVHLGSNCPHVRK